MEAMVCEAILSVYIISFLIGLPANLVALYAFSVKIHSKPLPTDILLLNLTLSDLLFLIVLPFKMHEAVSGMKWTLHHFLCTITTVTFFSTIYTSSLLLMAVSVVRYIGVAFPVAFHQLCRPVYAVVISAVVWLISAAHCSIVLIIQHHPTLAKNNSSVCYENFTEDQLNILLSVRLEFFLVLCLIPLVVSVYCYLRCILILFSQPMISRKQKQKAIGMASGTLAVFLICVVPYNVSHVVGFFQGESPTWRYYALLLSAFNTCIDPIIFYFSSSKFHCTGEKSIFRKCGITVTERHGTHSS
ncbi:free fatty acid receptor 2-like [Lates calcarifer]|uniref:Free fatty acid receptor 2-like n=1 Tax=Lates calcarifer TaxID=8187 RepID=A0A4W6C6Z1_LATCA|nr:free fatty acid receptor 2-like [Lates calcarifer]XP_018517791.1 free fatty acid receptor 2-like [Lates calcarifer]XP_018518683.1 free fatty acid receptor 2-like [Lates calcarifer]